MTITADGWIDWAERVPGHLRKVNVGINPVKGIFLHSAEGYETYLRWNPSQTPEVGGQKSWHLSNLKSGRLLQHYPLTARCWHATAANQSYIGFEHEGFSPIEKSLTEAQINTSVQVIREISQLYGWVPRRPHSPFDTSHTLWEHNEVVRLGGSGSECPSGRIPWYEILRRLDVAPVPPANEDDEMIRHVAPHADNGLLDRVISVGVHFWNVRGDFGLPADAVRFRAEVRLKAGAVRFHDGNRGQYAGEVGWDGARYGFVDVNISEGMTLYGDPEAHFELLSCIGYWR